MAEKVWGLLKVSVTDTVDIIMVFVVFNLFGYGCVSVFFRGAELFQATIVKAVRARLEEERKSVEQLKRQ